MRELDERTGSTDRKRIVIVLALVIACIAAAIALLHGPSIPMALTGDSYQLIQLAHRAAHEPEYLLADLDQFFRPSATWLLVADRVVWGGYDPAGYRVTSLLLHLVTCVLLWLVGRRFSLGWVSASLVSLIWCTSPFLSESVFLVACRYQSLLLAPWLILILAWPRADEGWNSSRTLTVIGMIFLAAAAKETWVVTPGLVLALELERNKTFREALRAAAAVGAAVVVYLAVYAVTFGSGKPYLESGPHILARIPSQLAAFFFLEEPTPFEVVMSWQGVTAFVITAGIAACCFRWRLSGTWVALALLTLPTLPTIAVPFMPVRYLAIPYAGFLLLIALWVGGVGVQLPRMRRAVQAGALLVAVIVMTAGVSIVRADLQDYRRIAGAHQVLLDEAAAVAPAVASGAPVAVVRDEQAQPLLEILREPAGFAKLPYTRHEDPYGLIDTAALFDWVMSDEHTRVELVPDWRESCADVPGRVLVHTRGGFVDTGAAPDLAAEAKNWQDAGRHVRVVKAVLLP
ncbi:MAG: hypothetical protein LJE93_05250 [Acidobacteria bacterium]|nr:hypothetical protein [Acidobacteriota bacterium]